MNFIVGIDGGGTKTTLVYKSLENEIKEKKVFGAFNMNGIGEEAFRLLLNNISHFICSLGNCMSLTIGAAGFSNENMRRLILEAFNRSEIKKLNLVGDHEIALEGALNGGHGIVLIAGTGSICIAKGLDGQIERIGGWGHLIGDAGSGYSLGKDAFSAVTKEIDGYGEKTVITELIKEKFKLNNRNDIISYVYSNEKSAVASISPLVEVAYDMGDEIAIGIIKSNVKALAELISSIGIKIGLKKPDVALCGGLLSKDTCVRRELVDYLKQTDPDKNCIYPILDAAEGALNLALKSL